MKFENNIPQLAGLINTLAREAVNETVTEIAEIAASEAPRDKGALAASIYPVLEGEESGFDAAKADALKANPKVEFEPALKLDDWSEEGVHFGAVDAPVDYAAAVHFGYANRDGNPFLERAGNRGEAGFEARLNGIADRLNL